MENLHEHSKLINALGGVRQIAKDYKLNINTVQAWKMRGIPYKFQIENPQFMQTARENYDAFLKQMALVGKRKAKKLVSKV